MNSIFAVPQPALTLIANVSPGWKHGRKRWRADGTGAPPSCSLIFSFEVALGTRMGLLPRAMGLAIQLLLSYCLRSPM